MIRVIKTDGTTLEVPEAVSAEVKGREVVCYDRRGVVVSRYPSEEVIIFGPHLPDPRDVLRDSDDNSASA